MSTAAPRTSGCERFVREGLKCAAECIDGRYVSLDLRADGLGRGPSGDVAAAASAAVSRVLEACGLHGGASLREVDSEDLGGGRRAAVFDLKVLSPNGEVLADGVAEVAYALAEGGEVVVDEVWLTVPYEHARRLRELAAGAGSS